MASAQVCPVVGTTNSVLPPSHPSVDLDKKGQKCPVTNATTDHHDGNTLSLHPPVKIPPGTSEKDASACPVLEKTVTNDPQAKKLDEGICPVVGSVTTVLPPDHPSVEGAEGKACPVTNAKVGHHKDAVVAHPSVKDAPEGAVCPVVGHN